MLKKFFHNLNFNITALLLSGFIIRLFLANFGTLQLDHGTFVAWANTLAENGFRNFYSGWSDYLPGYLYILYFLGKINQLFPELQTLTFKLPAIISDLLTGLLIYKIASKKGKKKLGLGLSSLYVFNPAIIYNSTLWGQVDSLTALFSVASIYFLTKKKTVLSSTLLSVGTLIKPQAAFIAPAILYLAIKNKWRVKKYVLYIVIGLLIFTIAFLPFSSLETLFKFIFERLSLSASQYPYGSVNAFSFWGIFGFWKEDAKFWWVGATLAASIILFSFFKLVKRKDSEYKIAAISMLVTFLFLTRMHERHLLPVLAPLIISSINFLPSLFSYVGFSITYVANLAYSYVWISSNFKEIFNPVITKFLIVLNIFLSLIFLISLFNNTIF